MSMPNPIEFLKQNPLVVEAMILMPIIIAAVIFGIMRVLENREEHRRRKDWEEFHASDKRDKGEKAVETTVESQAEDKPLPKLKDEKELTVDELRTREERLREREERLKSRKLMELEDKERFVERKHISGVVKEERKIADAIEQQREQELRMEELRNNRKRLVKLIELAEDRYRDGLMSEKNFRGIMGGYQKELVDADVEMTKLRGYNI
ncbi:MAG: hypothetical protein V1703_03190 [Candidatus Altiarchaeota archaeon]